jgi:LysR family glycine cleavage system transcriptional activator
MANWLPGLGLLRGFEATARHLSFTRAAAELGVTPAAVSHHVRELERLLQVTLLRRSSRSVKPTAEGEILRAGVAEGLESIRRAVQRITGETRRRLVISVSPSFAAKWLMPRLPRFLKDHPDADVRLDVNLRPPAFSRDDADLGLRFGNGVYEGLGVDRLFDETIFPVCSPALLAGPRPLKKPEDLRHHTLLHVEWHAQGAVWPSWEMWLQAAGVTGVDANRGLHLSLTALALQAAMDGQGVALGDSTLVADDLAAGRLVRPFRVSLRGPAGFCYHLVYPPTALDRPLVKAFRDWVLLEAREARKAAA